MRLSQIGKHDMIFSNIRRWIHYPDTLNRDTLCELRNMIACYPYFQSLRLLYLKNLYILHDKDFDVELQRSALYITDRIMLFYLIKEIRFDEQPHRIEKEIKKKPSVNRTLALIDEFLTTIPEKNISGQKQIDYSDYILNSSFMESDNIPNLKKQELIDKFIKDGSDSIAIKRDETNINEPFSEETSIKEEDDDCFTETLAKIYIKQKRYSKALEIIKKLSLKYPKKNAYFADQIRFLEKLIINTNSK